MATKQIFIGSNSREVILKGVNIISDVVKSTLGAKGRNVTINSIITKDGVTVAKAIRLGDTDESIGANAVKAVAEKTVKDSGDGTTTASLIFQSIVTEGFKLLAAGMNGQELKRGIDKAVDIVSKELEAMAEKIEIDSPKLKMIAAISGNNNEEIGNMIAEAFVKTGKDGVITLESSNTGESYMKIVEGMHLQKGYFSSLFINNQENLTTEFKDCFILISEAKITTIKEVEPIMKKIYGEGKAVIMIAEDFDGEALYTINHNKIKGFPVCLIKSPGFGDNKKAILQDIAAVTGATIANDESGVRLDTLKITDLGKANKVVVGKEETTIFGGAGEKHDVDERVSLVRKLIDLSPADNPYEKRMLEERLAKLTGGIGVIYVGAATEVELKEKMDRFDDAKRATACALQEGIVVGGGIALIRCQEGLDALMNTYEGDELAGVKLIRKVLEAPFRQMAKNAEVEILVKEVCGQDANYGYNFKTDKFENLVEAGVIDPCKVVRVALVNAASVAGTLLTTDSVIINVDDELPPMLRK